MPPKRTTDKPLRLPNKKLKKAAPTYDTFDDAFDEAVIQEEKGERYRVGDKVNLGLAASGFPLS